MAPFGDSTRIDGVDVMVGAEHTTELFSSAARIGDECYQIWRSVR